MTENQNNSSTIVDPVPANDCIIGVVKCLNCCANNNKQCNEKCQECMGNCDICCNNCCTACSRFMTGFCSVMIKAFTAFFFFVLIFAPSITTIICFARQSLEQKILTLMVCSIIQSVLSVIGAILVIVAPTVCGWEPFCVKVYKPKALVSGGYSIYCLAPWLVTTIIASWTIAYPLSWYNFVIYVPLWVYGLTLLLSYACNKGCDEL